MILAVAALLLAVTTVAHAQANPDSIKRRNNCRLAVQVLETGHPAPKREWAASYIVVCTPEEQVAVYLGAARAVRYLTDTLPIRRALLVAGSYHDGDLFREVLSIAGDRGASVTARVFAFMALAEILDPKSAPEHKEFIVGVDKDGFPLGSCSRRTMDSGSPAHGPTPLPVDYRRQIIRLANRVSRDTTELADVRSAAACG